MNETIVLSAREAARRIFHNARALISAKAFGGVLSLAYLGIAARSLGPIEMGFLVLAHAYVLLVSRIARFQSWQAIIRFGAPMIGANDQGAFRTLVRFTVKLDLLSGLIAIVIAVGLVAPVGRVMNWPPEAMSYIYVYCLAAPFLMAATPTGILRLFDRFLLLSWQTTLMPIARFVGAIILWANDGGLTGFLIVWIVSAVLDGATLWVLGWRELKSQGLMPEARRGAGDKAAKAWLPFMIKTNFSSTIDQTKSQLPVLVVGAVLGSAASGFFQLATNLSNLIAHPTNMLNEATYPELSRVNASLGAPAMRSVAMRSIRTAALVALPFVAIFMAFGEPFAVAVGGSAFAPAGILVAWLAFGQLSRIASLVMESAVLAVGRAGYVLAAQSVSALVTVAILFAFLKSAGLIGAPIAIIAGWSTLIAAYLLCLYKR